MVLIAKPGTPAQSSCADTDDNDIGGLLSFSAQFQDVRTKEIVRVEMTSSEDIDQTGKYFVTAVVHNVTIQTEVRVTRTSILHFDEDRT